MVIGNVFLRQSPFLRRFPTLLSQAISKNPTALAATMSSSVMKPLAYHQRMESHRGLLLSSKISALSVRGSATEVKEVPPSHARKFYWERVWTLGMVPLLPAALFIHNPVMDYALATAVALHIHWGLEAVIEDYARPFVVGEAFAKISRAAIYVFSLLMYIGLLHFNYADVGITKAFEMIWSL